MGRLLLALALTLGLAAPACAAVAFDTFANNFTHVTSATSVAVSITVGAGSNRVLVVVTANSAGPGISSVTSITGAGATWQGAAFATAANGTSTKVEVWYGTNPSTGAQTVTVNFGALAANTDFSAGVFSYNGVDQTTPLANFISRTTAGALNTTVPTGGAAVSIHGDSSNAALTAGDCTTTVDYTDGFNGAQNGAHCATSPTSTFTWTVYNVAVGGAVAVQQVSAAGANARTLTGVGQ